MDPDFEKRMQRRREIDALRDEITKLAGHLNAANYRFLKLIAEFDRRKGWVDNATHSCAHWLNWKCGIDLGAARKKVRVARALEKLPKISAAMERGEISYSNVRAITRVACPETEGYLLDIARHGTAHHVEKMVRSFRALISISERPPPAGAASGVTMDWASRYYWVRRENHRLCTKDGLTFHLKRARSPSSATQSTTKDSPIHRAASPAGAS